MAVWSSLDWDAAGRHLDGRLVVVRRSGPLRRAWEYARLFTAFRVPSGAWFVGLTLFGRVRRHWLQTPVDKL